MGQKCKNCGSSSIEVDSARGDAVCTNCGAVLESNIIVAEVEFQDNAHGASTAIGQFVSADSKGRATGFGASFHVGSTGVESREITLRKARHGITAICQQLHMNQQCIEIACNFFKLALNKNLTKGRPSTHIQAACVYLTCRTEETSHLLIDLSDVLQICCYTLGRTYVKLAQALCINTPSIDPCLYILRFASKLSFDKKTHEVSMTALRLVQRMKRDSLHSGRRPSGLCGAALLLAARLHEFSRTPSDIVRIVRVHESTLRKRLLEFGDTPTSALTLDEFMTVDLEEEQDPPSFKAARKRDKERLHKLMDEESGEQELTLLRKEIERQLQMDIKNKRNKAVEIEDDSETEEREAEQFTIDSTLGVVRETLEETLDEESKLDVPQKISKLKKENLEVGLGPSLALMGLFTEKTSTSKPSELQNFIGKGLSKKHESDVDVMMLHSDESRTKLKLWRNVNVDYLRVQQEKQERIAKEREEGKPEKVKKKRPIKRAVGPSATPAEAMEKMLKQKKLSSKINYEILKSLNSGSTAGQPTMDSEMKTDIKSKIEPVDAVTEVKTNITATLLQSPKELPIVLGPVPKSKKEQFRQNAHAGLPVVQSPASSIKDSAADMVDLSEYDDQEIDVEPVKIGPEIVSIANMLHSGADDDYYGYEEY